MAEKKLLFSPVNPRFLKRHIKNVGMIDALVNYAWAMYGDRAKMAEGISRYEGRPYLLAYITIFPFFTASDRLAKQIMNNANLLCLVNKRENKIITVFFMP